jgi:hypothetical protein
MKEIARRSGQSYVIDAKEDIRGKTLAIEQRKLAGPVPQLTEAGTMPPTKPFRRRI